MSAATDSPSVTDTRSEERRAMGVACGAHALHDGYTDLVIAMLPIWQAEFALSYAAIGTLRGVLAGTMASFQIPSGMLSERFGTPLVLAGGTALAGLAYCLAVFTGSFPALIAVLFLVGLGASTQHPLGSSLVAHAFAAHVRSRRSGRTTSRAIWEKWRCQPLARFWSRYSRGV
jgi:MFS family permease